ncbi:PLAC8 family-domain-containing protein [Tirmania nivea]|nr:PLAC8 family-domain-containing protein [Tirmania nivea]
MSQSPNAPYELYTLHSPPVSPQQESQQFQPMDTTPQHLAAGFPPPPQISHYPEEQSQQAYYTEQPGTSYSHQQYHPALDIRSGSGLPSPGLPSPGLTPPYSSQPTSPSFPPGPYQQKPDGYAGGPSSLPGHIQTSLPVDMHKDPVPRTPIYTPGSMSGPNGGIHAPGQISHPNQQPLSEKYKHSAWSGLSEIGICCTGCWCPCILYSRTKHRLKTSPNSNLNDFQSCNPHCMAFCILSPVSWVFTFLQRTRIRENYRLEGTVCGDCMRAYCCSCCTLIQDEREVMEREDERRRFAGPGSGVVGQEGYKRSEGMTYPR